MTDTVGRRRLFGAALALVAFVLGVAVGSMLPTRRAGSRMITITTTNEIPAELAPLSLTDAQRTEVVQVLSRGRDRVVRVVDSFTPVMQAAMDSIDAEIRPILTPQQRTTFDSLRAADPPLRRVLREK
ncbi:MAG: hypothetical protein U0132_20705 [Gemmatimonadaceae bacterium]